MASTGVNSNTGLFVEEALRSESRKIKQLEIPFLFEEIK